MIAASPIISVVPETHFLLPQSASTSHFDTRADGKGKEFISLRDDDSHLEWRVTKTHTDPSTCAAALVSWLSQQPFNMSMVLTVPESSPLLGPNQIGILESVCSSFLVSKSRGDICASAWLIDSDRVVDLLRSDDKDIVPTSGEGELVPETDSVRIKSVLDFQRFIRRIENSVGSCPIVFIRFVLFDLSRIFHFILIRTEEAAKTLSAIPQARMVRKTGASNITSTSTSLAERCLLPLLAGNAKPFLVIDARETSDKNIVTFQTLMDIGEKMCITALACEAEIGLRIEDFDVIENVDNLPLRKGVVNSEKLPRRQAVVKQQTVDHFESSEKPPNRRSIKTEPPKLNKRVSIHVGSEEKARPSTNEDSLLQEISQLEMELENQISTQEISEVEQLRAKNLALKCEVDRLAASGDHSNSYSNHLVAEVKQLRLELAKTEAERRKYETSKRLLDSLMEKSNKLKLDSAAKSGKIEEMKRHESVLKSELGELKRNCEYLLAENRQLVGQLEEAKSRNSASPREVPVESFYHEFLFPFNRKKEVGKTLVGLHETLQKIERVVAVSAPASLLDVKRCLTHTDKVKEFMNELVSASEKLEISAVTLIKKYSN